VLERFNGEARGDGRPMAGGGTSGLINRGTASMGNCASRTHPCVRDWPRAFPRKGRVNLAPTLRRGGRLNLTAWGNLPEKQDTQKRRERT
jgi:hypothetical protein